jgi:hypothetical protein
VRGEEDNRGNPKIFLLRRLPEDRGIYLVRERFLNLLKTYSFYVRVAEPGQMRRT